ncbi:response regulator FixJ [Labrys wisconsinensis]|uniref:Two-component system response regulator FixJ n=1 Tax=Labrys wisconsinensis TaxID=425677 RepID=A0ABU0J8H8_9HYPH|nr:response regulator FixJ [Labrys wisconsinensis]MDQ0469831.1 two-component system response regulator FixJ [Labrys wisconsinensis]
MAHDLAVHVVDDDIAVRQSLAFLFATAGISTRLYDSAEAFLQACTGATAGCVVTDVRMPGMDGLELLRRLRDLGSAMPVIVITGHGDIPLAVAAMKDGAADFIEKPFDDGAIIESVRAALDRQRWDLDRRSAAADLGTRVESLSERERQVLDGLLEGHPNKTIAAHLAISPRTVEIYRANLMTKMRASSLSELVRMALAAGVGRGGDPQP